MEHEGSLTFSHFILSQMNPVHTSSHIILIPQYTLFARMGEGRSVYRVLVRRPEGKRPLGRPSHRWQDNIKCTLGR
jgi:hypothetical protein